RADGVFRLALQPIAFTAARYVDARRAALGRERRGEIIEVAAVAREPVHAHHDVRIGGQAPVGVGDAMKAAVAERVKKLLSQFIARSRLRRSRTPRRGSARRRRSTETARARRSVPAWRIRPRAAS